MDVLQRLVVVTLRKFVQSQIFAVSLQVDLIMDLTSPVNKKESNTMEQEMWSTLVLIPLFSCFT